MVVIDAAILIEAGWDDLCDEVWIATAPEAHVIQRLGSRNNLTEEQVRARMASQISTEERVKHAHVIIENDGDLEELRRKVRAVWKERLAGRNTAARHHG
ncbi:MAG: dephospho-CoA kinase [Dehalococcoidia bacterium]|nr:dephospho-CoA kinase [Dehalococcoidia bacterium]